MLKHYAKRRFVEFPVFTYPTCTLKKTAESTVQEQDKERDTQRRDECRVLRVRLSEDALPRRVSDLSGSHTHVAALTGTCVVTGPVIGGIRYRGALVVITLIMFSLHTENGRQTSKTGTDSEQVAHAATTLLWTRGS
jgi:hypothetical protein